jgi:hypothetical protein
MKNYRHPFALIFLVFLFATATVTAQNGKTGKLHVSANHHFLVKEDGTPFFWLGDTGWLLFSKLNREEAVKYLEDRRKKGFNVIQVMVLHGLGVVW